MSKRILTSFRATSCGVLLAAGWFALHTFPLQGAVPQDDASPPTRIRVGGKVQ